MRCALAALLITGLPGLTGEARADHEPVGEAVENLPLVAVLPFTGVQAKLAEAAVIRSIRRRVRLVNQLAWDRAAKQIAAPSHSSDDIAAVAKELGVAVVVTGSYKRESGGWALSVSFRDGESGKPRDKLRYVMPKPRIPPRVLAKLTVECDEALTAALVPSDKKEEETAAVADDSEKKGEPDIASEELLARKKTEVVSTTRKIYPWFEFNAGLLLSGRQFDFNTGVASFKSGLAIGLRIDGTIYPLAFTRDKFKGALAGLGLGITLDKPFWPDTQYRASSVDQNNNPVASPIVNLATTELRVEGGLRWRFTLLQKLPRPELTVHIEGGLHSFAVAKAATVTTPPDVSYQYALLGLAIRLHFVESVSISAGIGVEAVTNAGPAQTPAQYGAVSTIGFRPDLSLDFFLYKGLKMGISAFYERYKLAIPTTQFIGSAGASTKATSAIDQYFGGVVSLGYVF